MGHSRAVSALGWVLMASCVLLAAATQQPTATPPSTTVAAANSAASRQQAGSDAGSSSGPSKAGSAADSTPLKSCTTPEYGVFGVPATAAPAPAPAAAGRDAANGGAAGSHAAAAAAFLAEQHCQPLAMPGRLLAVGGISNCEGAFIPLAPQLSPLTATLTTDAVGRFNHSAATLGLYSWRPTNTTTSSSSSSSSNSSCVDDVLGLPITYNWELVAPVYRQLVVTDLALLTQPAAAGSRPADLGSAAAFNRVYRAFGLDTEKLQFDPITYENVTSSTPLWPALMGINAQLSFISHAVATTLLILKKGPKQSPEPQLAQIGGIQDSIWSTVLKRQQGEGQEVLVSREAIRQVLAEADARNALPRWPTSSQRGQEVLFDSIARIVANSNRELLAPTVEVAMACATAALAGKPRVAPECSVPALAISIAKGAKLQKGNLTNDIVALAQAYVLTGDALNTLETTTAPHHRGGAASVAIAASERPGDVPQQQQQDGSGAAEKTEEEESKDDEKWETLMPERVKAETEAVEIAHSRPAHALRPECDYHNYMPGTYPPDSCSPYKSYPKAQLQSAVGIAQVDGASWGSVEPDGLSQQPAKRKGLTGLLGLFGNLGVVGAIPSGGLLHNSVAQLPAGTIVVVPGLVLAPYATPLSAAQSNGVMPWSFGGSCGMLGGRLANDKISGNTPQDILKHLPQITCLPKGWLYSMPDLVAAGFSPKLSKLPTGAVVLSDDTLYLPHWDGNTLKSLSKAIPGVDATEWSTPNHAESEVVKVVEADGRHYVVISDEGRHLRKAATAAGDQAPTTPPTTDSSSEPTTNNADGNNDDSATSNMPGVLHGNAECIQQGAPPASCAANAPLGPVGTLSTTATTHPPAPLKGAAVAIGYIQGCGGDYFATHELSAAVEDVSKLNVDRRFSRIFKSFTTGVDAKSQQTWGSFGVGNVTGRGHVFLTNAWACAEKLPADSQVCVDSWTGVQIKVPIGGLTPYGSNDQKRDALSNVDVLLSPLSLMTLVNISNDESVVSAYTDAFNFIEAGVGDRAMVSDPVRMVKSGKTPLVKRGVALMAENAKILNTLTTARALYECRSAAGHQLSNELFVQWTERMVSNDAVMHRPGAMKKALIDLCLDGSCSDNAVGGVMMLNKMLSMLRMAYEMLPDDAPLPLSLGDDLVKLAQLAHVGQADLYDSIRSCCGLTGVTSSQPLDDFVNRMTELTAMAKIKVADIQAAAAVALGGGVETHTSNAAAAAPSTGGDAVGNLESSAATTMVGSLINQGGVRDCKGILFPLVEGESPVALATDSQGQFLVDEPLDGLYKFSSAITGSACVDSLTGIQITFPMIQQIPATLAATVTPISLLSGPAKSDPQVRALATVNGQLSPELLVNYVYRLYGLDADEWEVDFFSFTGQALEIGSPRLAQVSGAIAQTMATYVAGQSLLTPLFAGHKISADQIAQCLVTATYQKIARAGQAAIALTDKERLESIFSTAYSLCAPPSRRRMLLAEETVQGSNDSSSSDESAGAAAAATAQQQPAAEAAAASSVPADADGGIPNPIYAPVFENGNAVDAADADTQEQDEQQEAKGEADNNLDAVPSPDGDVPKKKKAAAASKQAAAAPSARAAAGIGAGGKTDPEVQDLFAAAARVISVTNQKIQQTVVQAAKAASPMHKASAFNSRDAVANISSVAAVQQAEIAGAIGKLASTVATDLQEVQEYVLHEEEPGAAASATTSELQQGVVQKQIEDMETAFSGEALDDYVAVKAVLITPQAVSRGLTNIGQPLTVDEEGNVALFAPDAPKPKAKLNPGVVAGAVIGAIVAVGAIAFATVVLLRRRQRSRAAAAAAAAAADKPASSGIWVSPFATAQGAPTAGDGSNGGGGGAAAAAADGSNTTPAAAGEAGTAAGTAAASPSPGGAAAPAALLPGARRLMLIGRRPDGATAPHGSPTSSTPTGRDGTTPRSPAGAAGPLAEAVLGSPLAVGAVASSGGSLLTMMSSNPLYDSAKTPRAPADL